MVLEEEYKTYTAKKHRKKYAQYFTPEPIAKLMVDWVLGGAHIDTLLEPAFGLGVFSRIILQKIEKVNITAFDIDPVILSIAKENFATNENIIFFLEDYLFSNWDNKYDAIVCNPPYFKFHDYRNIESLEEIKKRLNITLSGFTNIYTLFLLKAIYQLKHNGRAAFIIPSEFLNSDYGKYIKSYLIKSNTLNHIITFDINVKLFDDAQTTSSIVLLEKKEVTTNVYLSNISSLSQIQNFPNIQKNKFATIDLDPSIKWRGYFKKKQDNKFTNLIKFNTIAKVVRGIATGSNEFFCFNREKVEKYGIGKQYLLPCIAKSKDVKTPFFTKNNFDILERNNAPVFLLNAKNNLDENVVKYLKYGEELGIHKKYLTSKRNPWYSLENRPPSPIWVGVFNRKGLKFVRNEAMISNLTTFHCIYLKHDIFTSIDVDLLFAYLLTDVAGQIFNENKREYGDGLNKFEPNDLNNSYMLDLSLIDKNTESMILSLFYKYRDSIFANEEDRTLLDRVNKMFLYYFSCEFK